MESDLPSIRFNYKLVWGPRDIDTRSSLDVQLESREENRGRGLNQR